MILSTTGAGAQSATPSLTLEPPSRYRNATMMIAGIVVAGIGTVLVGANAVAITAGCPHTRCSEGGGWVIPGLGLIAAGLVHVAVGVPLIIVGAQPPKPAATAAIPSWAAPTPTTIAGGSRSIALQWAF